MGNIFYDSENDALISACVRRLNDSSLTVGENTVDIDPLRVPEDFHRLKVMVWSAL